MMLKYPGANRRKAEVSIGESDWGLLVDLDSKRESTQTYLENEAIIQRLQENGLSLASLRIPLQASRKRLDNTFCNTTLPPECIKLLCIEDLAGHGSRAFSELVLKMGPCDAKKTLFHVRF